MTTDRNIPPALLAEARIRIRSARAALGRNLGGFSALDLLADNIDAPLDVLRDVVREIEAEEAALDVEETAGLALDNIRRNVEEGGPAGLRAALQSAQGLAEFLADRLRAARIAAAQKAREDVLRLYSDLLADALDAVRALDRAFCSDETAEALRLVSRWAGGFAMDRLAFLVEDPFPWDARRAADDAIREDAASIVRLVEGLRVPEGRCGPWGEIDRARRSVIRARRLAEGVFAAGE